MFRHKMILLTSVVFISFSTVFAQQSAYYNINKNYKSGIELFDQQKFASAAEQFHQVENEPVINAERTETSADISNIKINAQYYLAVCALELGNDDAEDLFLTFIRQNPENPKTKTAYYQVGRSYFKQEQYDKALEWFTKVDQYQLTGKESIEYQFKTGYSYFSTTQFDKAKPLFASVKEKQSTYKEDATYYYAYIAYLDKEYAAALNNFEKLKDTERYRSSYPYYITAIYFLDKRYDDVLKYAVPILKNTKQQNETEMLRIVAASYFAKVDYANTINYYERFMQQDNGKTQNNQDSYQIGYTYFKLKKYEESIEQLTKLINNQDEYSQNGLYTLGDDYIRTNNKQGARSAFQVDAKLDFDKELQEDALLNYAKLSYELEFQTIALEATRQFLSTYPKSAKINEAKTLLGKVLLSTRNYKDAINILESIPNKNADAREAYQKVTYFRGLEFYNERAFQNGISVFLRSIDNPEDPEILALATYWCAEAMYEVRKFGESVNNFEKFLAMPAARKTEVYNFANYGLGYAAFEAENYGKAATYFSRFLQGGEKDQKTINDATLRLADAYFGAKNYGSAMSYYDRIISSNAKGEDYALFQRGIIQGLQNQPEVKISTLESLLKQYPTSNYADDAGFEIAYTYFLTGNGEKAKTDLSALLGQYPRSSYVPKALVTIGLVNYDQNKDDAALENFKRVVQDYKETDEAKQALKLIEKIYVDQGNADAFITYANSTSIGNYTQAEQDNITFQAANNRFLRGDYAGTVEAINAYFDKFPKAVNDKQAKFIRAESLTRLNRTAEAIPDYEYILNDWTSAYTEKALVSISKIYLNEKKFNEAIVHLKKLEIASEFKSNYGFAINNLLVAYAGINMPDDVLKYARIIKEYEKSSEEEKFTAALYAGKAHQQKEDKTAAVKEFNIVIDGTKTIAAAEARYLLAEIQFKDKDYKTSQKTLFDLINKLPNYDYWVAKAFILLADNYVALKDIFQARSTLQSIIDNYDGKDEILATAKEKLENLKNEK